MGQGRVQRGASKQQTQRGRAQQELAWWVWRGAVQRERCSSSGAVLLFVSGFLSVWLHLVNRQQRRSLFLAAPPGTIAAVVSLTSRSGFGDLLLPYDDLAMMEKKLDGLRFQLDKRTGAILIDDYEPTGKSPSPSPGKLPLGELRS
ncbi:hypothetical protein K438DRAFT_1977642 [Mycena galopus ATCC 62051]|nr:hypothetical protein K438DRAFT_1977642 [Mycena galopus ATCC 62051]